MKKPEAKPQSTVKRTSVDLPRVDPTPEKFCASGGIHSRADMKLVPDWMQLISHDMRSPLALVKGYADFLLKTECQVSEEGLEAIERIQRTTRRALALLDNLLTLAGAEEGRMALKGRPVYLDELCRSIVDELGDQAKVHNIQLVLDTDLNTPLLLDRIAVERILVNLISNAIKFSDPSTTVRIHAHRKNGHYQVDVIDEGRGISPDQKEDIFEKFNRYPRDKEDGAGLGLTIARTLARLHGGDVTVESTLGVGSTFTFTVSELPPAA